MEWLTKYWKTIAAVVYLSICMLDFLAFPIIIAHLEYTRGDQLDVFMKLKEYPEVIRMYNGEPAKWIPFTLRGGGLFHISFGAILTGSILGRKNSKQGE